jgi:hypothetical protein
MEPDRAVCPACGELNSCMRAAGCGDACWCEGEVKLDREALAATRAEDAACLCIRCLRARVAEANPAR